jgi:FlaG/FlaF family flagellin (archaellin)
MGSALFPDDAAVSSVVGATVVVAVAVVLATTSAVFVLGLGDSSTETPAAADITYEYSQVGNGNLTMVYESGDTLDPSNVEVRADVQFRPAPGNATGSLGSAAVESYGLDSTANGSDWVGNAVGSGSKFGIVGDGSTLNNGTIRIVWLSPAGGETAVLGEWQGPGA